MSFILNDLELKMEDLLQNRVEWTTMEKKKKALSLSETIEGKIPINKGEKFVVLIGHVLR